MPVVRLQKHLSGVEREMSQTCKRCDHDFDIHGSRFCEGSPSCACPQPILKLTICRYCARIMYHDGPICTKCKLRLRGRTGWLLAIGNILSYIIYGLMAAILFAAWRLNKN